MKRLKLILLILLFSLCFVLTSCGREEKEGPKIPEEGWPQVYVKSSQKGHEGIKAFDGNNDTGWICEKNLLSNSAEEVKLDLGMKRSIHKITVNDSFEGGYTNEKDPYEKLDVLIEDWDCTAWEENDTPERAFDKQIGRKGWSADIKPDINGPVFMMVKFSEEISLGKIVLNNEGYGTVPGNFEIHVSDDGENYKSILKIENNKKAVSQYELKTPVRCRYLKYVVYGQEGEKVTMDEIILYKKNENKIYNHYPRKFSILVSTDDITYDIVALENFNEESIKTYEFDERQVRFIKYVVMEELNDNKPSLGEIIVE